MNNKNEMNEIKELKINQIDNKTNNFEEDNKKRPPIINLLQLNKQNIITKKEDNFNSKNSDKKNIKLPYMGLSKSKLNNIKINTLLNLEPFFTDFNNNMDKKGRDIIREIASEYKDEKYEINKVIFRYGDEADRYFLIYEGEVSLYFPFTEIIDMNIDEFFIYILRLRRYNELEMLNDVLLLNRGEFMKELDEGFIMDNFIYKLYTTYIKLKFDPSFLYHQVIPKKKKIKKINNNNIKTNNNINNKNNKIMSIRREINYYFPESNEIDINSFDTFNDRNIKELLLRIGDELIETMKWIMPEKMYNIVEETTEDEIVIKKLVSIPEILIEKYKQYNPNKINEFDYYKRILPIKMPNDNLINKKIIVMKYLYLGTLKKGHSFGDFNADSLSLFSHKYINIARHSLFNLHLHQHNTFRNMTAIATINSKNDYNRNTNKIHLNTNKIHLLSFNKKIYSNHFSKYVDRMNFEKKKFILSNSLFLNSNNKNLIRTYSICFQEKSIKEGEYIIKENNKLIESDIYISFIINGEFQSNCVKTISQIDEIIKIIGSEDKINETYSKSVKNIINTHFYDELIKKPINLKLNYMSKNDIIGLTEIFTNDQYFNNVICTGNNSKIYKVDARIIKLLADSDPVINDNKNIILYNKYQMLSDILLKQRKMFFDSFINIDKIENINKINDNKNINKIDNNIFPNKTIDYNYTPFPQKVSVLSSFDSSKFSHISPINKFFPLSTQNLSTMKSISNSSKIRLVIPKKAKKEEDLDQILVGLSRVFTLKEKRMNKHLEFEKKYKAKMEKLEKMKKLRKLRQQKLYLENIKYLKGLNKNLSFCDFQKSNTLFPEVYKFLPLLNNKESKKYESDYELVFPYESPSLVRSMSTSEINPLFYDDFNRSFNTSRYFNFKCEEENSENKIIDKKKDNFEYNIKFKSDIKLIKKPNQFTKNDKITERLRNIYNGKLRKGFYKNPKYLFN